MKALVFLTFAVISAPAPTLAGPSEAEVRGAIARGVAHLREAQTPQGLWRYRYNADHSLGITALAGLALLENGVGADDPAIGRAAEVVRLLAKRSDQTYDLALAILFLARRQAGATGPDDPLIRRLGARLAGGGPGGLWDYGVPLEPVEGEGKATRRRGKARAGDHSNTQFALLGVWAAGRHGLAVDGSLAEVDAHFRGCQADDGNWGYVPDQGGGKAMTCAGLMGLAISAARPALAERLSARARGAALAIDPAFMMGLKAVGEEARRLGPASEVYYLWSLERVCVALGLKDLDGFDWYDAGAAELVRRQRADGSWPESRWGSLPDTCLALLFLRKANLAFELDRVLKLPRAAAPLLAAAVVAPQVAEKPVMLAQGDAEVVIGQASDRAFPEVAVDFRVKRADGSPILDASRADFRVTEEGRDAAITSFSAPTEILETTVVLVLDRSLSMREEDRIGGLKAAVDTFLGVMPRGSRVAVVAFGSTVELLCPFTADPAEVRRAVSTLTPAGATRYYDAVAEAFERIGREPGRRAILALTDGEDTFSQSATLDSAIAAGRKVGVPVYTLGLGSEDEIEADALKKLAEGTRGRYFSARDASQLRGIYEGLARGLGESYRLTYRSDRPLPDGTLRPVAVYYKAASRAGVAEVFVPGMVVPAAGWSRLFLLLVGGLAALAAWGRRIK